MTQVRERENHAPQPPSLPFACNALEPRRVRTHCLPMAPHHEGRSSSQHHRREGGSFLFDPGGATLVPRDGRPHGLALGETRVSGEAWHDKRNAFFCVTPSLPPPGFFQRPRETGATSRAWAWAWAWWSLARVTAWSAQPGRGRRPSRRLGPQIGSTPGRSASRTSRSFR